MFYKKRIFYHLLFVVFFECNFCNRLSACWSAKQYFKPDEMDIEQFCPATFAFNLNYFLIVCKYDLFYIHDLYCREKGFFYKFFLQQHTTSLAYYYAWTAFEHVLKKFIGVVWVYKTWKDFEFYYGSVIGIGWYPQSLNFNKYFRIGFFDMFINLISVFMNVCHFLCSEYFNMEFGRFHEYPEYKELAKGDSQKPLVEFYSKLIKDKKYICVFDREYSSLQNFFVTLFIDGLSFINIKTIFGIKIKMLQVVQIVKFMKLPVCSFVSNISILANSVKKQPGKYCVIYPPTEDVFIYSYKYESHFFFGERDNIFWLLLELFIPNIEINISALH